MCKISITHKLCYGWTVIKRGFCRQHMMHHLLLCMSLPLSQTKIRYIPDKNCMLIISPHSCSCESQEMALSNSEPLATDEWARKELSRKIFCKCKRFWLQQTWFYILKDTHNFQRNESCSHFKITLKRWILFPLSERVCQQCLTNSVVHVFSGVQRPLPVLCVTVIYRFGNWNNTSEGKLQENSKGICKLIVYFNIL